MSVSCTCSVTYDGDAPEFFVEAYPKARKRKNGKVHTCCECREVIPVGSKYHKATGKWEGDIMAFKTCLPCASIRNYYFPRGCPFECLREEIGNCLGFDYLEVPDSEDD